jgi:hypothetical protein
MAERIHPAFQSLAAAFMEPFPHGVHNLRLGGIKIPGVTYVPDDLDRTPLSLTQQATCITVGFLLVIPVINMLVLVILKRCHYEFLLPQEETLQDRVGKGEVIDITECAKVIVISPTSIHSLNLPAELKDLFKELNEETQQLLNKFPILMASFLSRASTFIRLQQQKIDESELVQTANRLFEDLQTQVSGLRSSVSHFYFSVKEKCSLLERIQCGDAVSLSEVRNTLTKSPDYFDNLFSISLPYTDWNPSQQDVIDRYRANINLFTDFLNIRAQINKVLSLKLDKAVEEYRCRQIINTHLSKLLHEL